MNATRPRRAPKPGDLPKLPKTTSKTLAELRHDAELTQVELSGLAGISRIQLARLEAGRHAPSLDTLRRLAGVLGTSVAAVRVAVGNGARA